MHRTVVITGGSAGVGRATARAFAAQGFAVGLIARGEQRLAEATDELRKGGGKAAHAVADMADPAAVAEAAARLEHQLGPFGVWVNGAMATIFGPVLDIAPEEFRRAVDVTFFGNVYGTTTAIKHMRAHGGGTIVQVASALSYRGIPLQAPYCAAKHAIRGFTDSLRSELLHDRIPIRLTSVFLPGLNTPQFDWARNRMPRRPRPVPPVYQPELAARAILFAALNPRREVWVGYPTLKVLLGELVSPWLLDRLLARSGYSGQLGKEAADPSAPDNLFEPAPIDVAAHGHFDAEARATGNEFWTSRQRAAMTAAIPLIGWGLLRALRKPRRTRRVVAKPQR